MAYREQLPKGCPPDDAVEIMARRDVFRLVRTSPPSDDDFRSQRAEKANARFSVDECRARGVSVYSEHDSCAALTKLTTLKGRLVCRVHLDNGAGRIQQWGAEAAHHTWWPLASYNILANCSIEGT